MTSRERVLTALNHEEPDRVPLFVGTSGVTTLLGPAYERLKTHLGIRDGPPRWITKVLQYSWLEKDFFTALHAKVRDLALDSIREVSRQFGQYIDVFVISDDLGSQEAPLISPVAYRDMLKPHHADIIAAIKQGTAAKVFFHSESGESEGAGELEPGRPRPGNRPGVGPAPKLTKDSARHRSGGSASGMFLCSCVQYTRRQRRKCTACSPTWQRPQR